MKGFIEYLIASNEDFERELERESNHTEVPYLENEYQNWLCEQGFHEESIRKEMENLNQIDHDIFLFREDFFELLKTAVKERNAKLANKYFVKYDKLIDDWLQAATNNEIEENEETLREWKHSFERYRWFILRKKMDFFILPFQEDFVDWYSKGALKATAKQYVDHIERLYTVMLRDSDYADIFDKICQFTPPSPKDTIALLDQAEQFLKNDFTRNIALRKMNADCFSNCNTAFHYYVEYMKFRLLGKNTISRASRNDHPKIYYREEIIDHFIHQLYKIDYVREKQYKIFFSLALVRKILKRRDELANDTSCYSIALTRLLQSILEESTLMVASNRGCTTERFKLYQIESITIYPKEKVTVQFRHSLLGTIVCRDKEVDALTDEGYENGILLDNSSNWSKSTFEISRLSELSVNFSNEIFKYKHIDLSAFSELTQMLKVNSETEVLEKLPAEFLNEWAIDLLQEISIIFARQDLKIIYTSEYKMMNK